MPRVNKIHQGKLIAAYRVDGKYFNHTHRQDKRFFRKTGEDCPKYIAWIRGQWDGIHHKAKKNPYPAGKRHDEYNRGYDSIFPGRSI